MAVLLYSEIQDIALDRAQANVTVDGPFAAAEIARHINEAWADIYEISGGGVISADHTTIWEAFDTLAFSTKASISSRIREVVRLYPTANAAHTGGASANYKPIEKLTQERVLYLQRRGSLAALYGSAAKCFSITRIDETDETRIPRLRLDVFPLGSTSFATDYIPQFFAIDAVTNTQPSCTDLESRDIPLLAAMRMAPLNGRAELVPSIASDVSDRTKAALEAKFRALLDARQGK